MTLPEKILSLRTARGMSQGDLADRLEVSRQSVSKWETGQSVPDLDKIIRLADLFGVTTDYLLREAEAAKSAEEANATEAVVGFNGIHLRPVQVCGILLTIFGLLMTALAAMAYSRGELGHIELPLILLFVLPSLVLVLAPAYNGLAAAWMLLAGAAVVFLPAHRTTPAIWLVKFFRMMVFSDDGPVSFGLWGWQQNLVYAVFGISVILLTALTWKVWKNMEGRI